MVVTETGPVARSIRRSDARALRARARQESKVMHRSIGRILVAAVVVAGLAMGPSLAAGPVDGEITAVYWLSDTKFDLAGLDSGSEKSEAIGFRAELWFVKKLGVSAGLFPAELADSDETIDYNNLDVKWRLLSPTENNFLAIGAGWQQIDVDSEDTGGVRVVLDGRVALVGFLYFYGRAAYVPSLSDVGDLRGGSMTELEAGLMIKPAPFIQLFAGYRSNDVGFDGVDWTTDGAVAGVGVNF
jgi:hypothetical protein